MRRAKRHQYSSPRVKRACSIRSRRRLYIVPRKISAENIAGTGDGEGAIHVLTASVLARGEMCRRLMRAGRRATYAGAREAWRACRNHGEISAYLYALRRAK